MSIDETGYPATPGIQATAKRVMSALERGENLAAGVRMPANPSSDTEQCRAIVKIAREKRDTGDLAKTDIDIYDDAVVRQEQSGCYVQAWVWVENVYIVDDGDG